MGDYTPRDTGLHVRQTTLLTLALVLLLTLACAIPQLAAAQEPKNAILSAGTISLQGIVAEDADALSTQGITAEDDEALSIQGLSSQTAGTPSTQSLTSQATDEPIAQGEIGTCTWVIDANGKLTIAPKEGSTGTLDFSNLEPSGANYTPWYSISNTIKSAEFKGSIALTGQTAHLFDSCFNLAYVDLTGLDTSEATDLDLMFNSCNSLTSIDMSMLDVSSVQSMRYFLASCNQLTSVKLPDFSNAKPTNISLLFWCCSSLTSVDLSTFDTSAVTNAAYLFYGCTSLEKVIVGDAWDLESCANKSSSVQALFGNMFTNCEALVGANGTSFASSGVNDYTYARIDTAETPGYFWPVESDGQGTDPGTDPGTNPGDDPGTDPATDPGDDPGTDPGTDPGDDPGTDPGTNPGDDPGTDPGTNPGTDPGDNPGTDPETDPSADPGSDPSAGTDTSPATPASAKSGKPTVALSASAFAYNGKKRTPTITVKLAGKTLKQGRDYTVSFPKGCKAIGAYKVTVAGKGSYNFKVVKAFVIVPKTPKVKSLKAHKNSDGSSGFIARWTKSAKKGIGYQIRWSTSKKLTKNTSCTFKSSTSFAKKATAPLQVKKRAWLGKKVYVQVRAFKTVKGAKCYSSWSKAKPVKLKK